MPGISYGPAEIWYKPLNSGAVQTVEIYRAEHDGFVCQIRMTKVPACKPEYSYNVHRIGSPKNHENFHDGYATTLRGAKSAVSKAIAKLKTIRAH